MPEETQVLVELTQHSLHALRAVNGAVEAGGECALENKIAVEALLDAVAPARKTDGLSAVATVWPANASWYLSTDTEAMLDRTGESFRAIAASKQKDSGAALAYAACNSGDGGAVTPEGTDKWLLAFSPLDALEKASMGLLELKVDPLDVTPSVFSGIGAVVAGLRQEGGAAAVALWDLGTESSSLLLVTAKGVEATVPCAVAMDRIIEAVQSTLKLKFRGAGARLFFNEGYDFTEPGPRIAALLGPAMKEAISELPDTGKAPALACLGLTGKQAWFLREVAAASGTSPWQPDVVSVAAGLGITFRDGVAASFSPASCGLLGLLAGKLASSSDWNPAWVETQAEEPEPAPAPEPIPEPVPEPQPEPEPEPAPPPAPAPAPIPLRAKAAMTIDPANLGGAPRAPKPTVAPKSVTAPPLPSFTLPGAPRTPAPAVPNRPATPPAAPPTSFPPPAPPLATPPPFAAPPSFAPPEPSFAPPEPSFAPPEPSFAAPAPAPPPAPKAALPPMRTPSAAPTPSRRPPSFSNPGFPLPETLPAETTPPMPATPPPLGGVVRMGIPTGGVPPRTVTSLPFEALKGKAVPDGGTTPPMPAEEPAEPKSKIGFYIAVGVVSSLLAAAIAVVLEAHRARVDAYDLEQQEELAHHNADLLLKQQEQKSKDEAERIRKEMEAEIEQTRKQAEEETRRAVLAEVEAARVAKLPGTILLATVPAGASVSIDGAAPIKTPVKAEGIPPGTHRIQVSLVGYDPVEMSAEIKGSMTTDLGSVALQTSYGSLDLTSTPDGLDYALRPAADPKGNPVRTGKTPASLADIVHGDYLVTFSRPGCRDHVEAVSVQKGVKSPVDTKYLDGSLELTSDPSGASVNEDGTFLGTTPLSLHDLTPKTASFDLTLPGYDSTPVSCDIPEGQTLKYSAQLLRKDRVFTPAEVKTPPQSYESPQPVLTPAQRKLGADALVSLVVSREGIVSNVKVVRASDDDVGRRCKAAVEKWKFRPATAPDDRTVDAQTEVPFKFAPSPK